MKKVSDEMLVKSYSITGSVWKTAKEVGMCGQSVYERLNKLGIVKKMKLWTSDDDKRLCEDYVSYKKENKLDELAQQMGRTKQFICRKAKILGLTNPQDKQLSSSVKSKLSVAAKKWIKEKGHPRGYLGHKHSEETRRKLSAASLKSWNNPLSIVNSDEFRQRLSDNLHNRKMNDSIYVYSNRGDHHIVLGEKDYVFKSTWEVEIAKRLHALFCSGYILRWSYEARHFDFADIKRKVRSYCPDFEVVALSGEVFYIEVKGWKMKASMQRIELFKERYPYIKLYVIDEKEYGKILSNSDYLRRRCVQI